MAIRIIRLHRAALEEIIKKLGPLVIGRCRPYIDYQILFFDVSIRGACRISGDDLTVTIDIDDKSVTIRRSEFFSIIMS